MKIKTFVIELIGECDYIPVATGTCSYITRREPLPSQRPAALNNLRPLPAWRGGDWKQTSWLSGGREQAEGTGLLTPFLLPNSPTRSTPPDMKKTERGEEKPSQEEMAASLTLCSSSLEMNASCLLYRRWRAWPKSCSALHPWWLAQSVARARNSVHILLFSRPCHTTATNGVCLRPLKPKVTLEQSTLTALNLESHCSVSHAPCSWTHRGSLTHRRRSKVFHHLGRPLATLYFLWSSSLSASVPPPWPQGGDIPLPMSL